MSKFDSVEGQVAWRKLQVGAREAHVLGRHKYPAEFIGFCPDCQAASFPDGELHHVIRIGDLTPAMQAFLATSFAKRPMLSDTQQFETLDFDGGGSGWYIMAQEERRGSAKAGCGFASYLRAVVTYDPQGTYIVECQGEVEYVQASGLGTLALTLR